jgi:hypothetical protein
MVGGRPQSYRWRGWSVHVCDLQTLEATVGLGQMPVESMHVAGMALQPCGAQLQPSQLAAGSSPASPVHHLAWPRAVLIFQPAPDCICSTHRITMARIHLALLLLAVLATIASACKSMPVPTPLADPHPDTLHPSLPYPSRAVRNTTRADRQITN